jgi:hypothetical protein
MFQILQLQLAPEFAYGIAAAVLVLGVALGFFLGRMKRKVIAITKKLPEAPAPAGAGAPVAAPAAPQPQAAQIVGEALPELLPPGVRIVTESNTNDLFGLYHLFGSRMAAQQFLASGDSLKEIAVKAYRIGMPSTFVLEIRPDAGDTPAGEILSSQSIEGGSITANYAGDWISAPAPCALTKGNKYWIVAKLNAREGDARNKIVLKGVYRDAYHEGISAESADYGSKWEKRQYSDIAFKAVMQTGEQPTRPSTPRA